MCPVSCLYWNAKVFIQRFNAQSLILCLLIVSLMLSQQKCPCEISSFTSRPCLENWSSDWIHIYATYQILAQYQAYSGFGEMRPFFSVTSIGMVMFKACWTFLSKRSLNILHVLHHFQIAAMSIAGISRSNYNGVCMNHLWIGDKCSFPYHRQISKIRCRSARIIFIPFRVLFSVWISLDLEILSSRHYTGRCCLFLRSSSDISTSKPYVTSPSLLSGTLKYVLEQKLGLILAIHFRLGAVWPRPINVFAPVSASIIFNKVYISHTPLGFKKAKVFSKSLDKWFIPNTTPNRLLTSQTTWNPNVNSN